MAESLDEPIPGGARWAYVFGSGLLFIFISQIVTGICLALYYVPSAETAHVSVAYITKQVAAGAFLRSLHSYGASAMMVVLALHFLQTFLYGSYKGRRELLWISGATVSLFVLAMGFTGYLLPWDQKAYFATAVGTNVIGQVPLIGGWLTRLLRGGDTIGTLTLSRFYVAHVFLIPAAMLLLIGIHVALFRKAGPAGPIREDPLQPKLPPEPFYPRQVLMDMTFALLLIAALGVLAYFHPVTLGPIANPTDAHFLPRPEWYYLPMFEWLKFFEGSSVVLAIVVLPGLLAALLFLLPFLDRSLERRPWRRPLPLLGVAIVLGGLLFLGNKSRLDDARDPGIAAQLALQAQQEQAYNAEPFEPYVESPGTIAPVPQPPTGPIDPRVAQGRGIFDANGCSGCHGETGTGTARAPSLVGITGKIPQPQLIALLRNPNSRMRAGGMPAVQVSGNDMAMLLAYLGAVGTTAANVPATYGVAPRVAAAAAAAAGAPLPVPPGNVTAPAVEESASAAALGRQMYQARACGACHGQAGGGTERAPALGPRVEKLANDDLARLLQVPNAAMRAGGMPPVMGATPEQLQGLIAYLRTLPGAAAAGTPTLPAVSPGSEPRAANPTAPPPPAAAPPPPSPVPAAVSPAPAMVAGRDIYLANGCAACHGPSGEGTHFAPALIGVRRKYSTAQLSALVRNPTQKMKDGGMPTIAVSDRQLSELVAYVASLSGAVAAPAAPPPGAVPNPAAAAAPAPPLSPEALRGRELFQHYSCETCHGTGGLRGTAAAPGLAGTASVLPAPVLENLLRHHSRAMQQGGMPLTNLNARDMAAIIAFIRSLPATPPDR